MKDFILGLIIGAILGLWIGVNLGQGQDVFSNPFHFLVENKQVAATQTGDVPQAENGTQTGGKAENDMSQPTPANDQPGSYEEQNMFNRMMRNFD